MTRSTFRSSRRTRAVTMIGAAMATVIVVASCGVQTGGNTFEGIDDEDVPNRLAETSTTTSTSTTSTTIAAEISESTVAPSSTEPPRTQLVKIYFLSRGRLRRVEEPVPVPAQPSDLVNELVSLLEGGPAAGSLLDTAVPPGLFNDGFSQEDGTLTIDLDPETFEGILELENQRAAIAQIVYTFLLSLNGLGAVQFTLDGRLLEVPTGNRLFTDQPVTLDDYESMTVELGPPESTTPDTAPSPTDIAVTSEPDPSATTVP
jgi:spore germination protein GerM